MQQPAPAKTVDPSSNTSENEPDGPPRSRWTALAPWISTLDRLAVGGVFVAASIV
jgi:hypothetical protein